ncbi:MAG: hypothetical protein HY099_01085 [Nitrospirae bacterium]|nr:hypothetical protein [Nitrospirota bacterium]
MIKIDALYFLLLIESSLLLLVAAVYLFFRSRKHKGLYQKTLKQLADAQGDIKEKPFEEQPLTEESPVQEPEAVAVTEPVESEVLEEVPATDNVKTLKRMVNFQKKTILDLMCYKDIFESAQKRIAAIQQSNNDLQEKFVNLTESGADKEGLAAPLEALEKNNNELQKFIGILERENMTISEKFRVWEEEFKKISEYVGDEAEGSGIDEARYNELAKEKEELFIKAKEIEEKLQEKGSQLDAMHRQYEDLEKEYMILYRQQQAQQQQ